MYRKKPSPPKPEWNYYGDKVPYWRYYDTPDGQQTLKKTVVATRYATLTGIAAAFYDVTMFSHPKGMKNIMKRSLYIVGPMAAMGAAFPIVTNTLINVRKKDDYWNYLAGAWTSASICGLWKRSGFVCYNAVLAFTIAALLKKAAVTEGWTLFPEFVYMNCNAYNANSDYSLVKDWGPKGYTTGTPPPPDPITPPVCNLDTFRNIPEPCPPSN